MKKSKKKSYVIIFFIIILILVSGMFLVNKLRGHGYLSAAKNYLHYYLNKPDFSQYAPLQEEQEAWYQEGTLIAHAMGGIDEVDYTNSVEAFEHAVLKGYKVFEVDFSVTSDGKVVCAHDFKEFGDTVPSYTEFMENKINASYSPMDMEQLIVRLAQQEDIYLMTDFKWDNSFGSSNQDVRIIMDALSACIDAYQDTSLYDRVILQFYSEENYHFLEENYGFSNYVYTLYQYAYPIYDEVAAFCLEYKVPVVTMSKERATKEQVDSFKKWNIKVYSHTVNTLEEARQQMDNGVGGIYTDWILPEEMEKLQ